METKDKTVKKLPYIAAEITFISISMQDIITASFGNDGVDNWMSDDFDIISG